MNIKYLSDLIKTLPKETVFTGGWIAESGFRFCSSNNQLVGKKYKGHLITSSTARYFTIETGETIKRQGAAVWYEETYSTSQILKSNNIEYRFRQGDVSEDIADIYYINGEEYYH